MLECSSAKAVRPLRTVRRDEPERDRVKPMAGSEPVSVGELLKRYRIQAGLTQEELAERAGLSARGIRALEAHAQRAPRKDTLVLLESALGLTTTERSRLETAMRQRRVAPHSSAGTTTFRRARPPLVGRERERALLDHHLTSDTPPLLLLAGEPGIGKSRLLEEAAERAENLGWTVLAGGCSRRSAQEPYAPRVEALARFLTTRGSARQRLDLQGCAWLVRLLPELAQQTLGPSLAWTLPPAQERRLMFAAVARYLTNVAGQAGTLLILDDLHWAGADALDLLAFLLREAPGGNLRILGAYRDTDVVAQDPLPMLLDDLAREGLAALAPLAPLAPDEATQLLTDLLADMSVDIGEARRRIVSRAGGIPYYLVSSAQEARAGVLANDAEALAVPWNVAASIRQRVSLLAEPAREALTVAAVVERQIPRDVLLLVAGGLGYSEGVTLRALETAVHARLLVERAEGAYAFMHDLIRETVDADLGGARRAFLHRRVAEALERLPQGKHRAAELAWHFARGDELARALPYAMQAGDQAEAVYAHSEAELHYQAAAEWARQVGDRAGAGEALEKRSDVLFRLARFTEAYACLESALRLYRADENWERLAWSTAQSVRAGDFLGFTETSLTRVEELLTTLAAVATRRDDTVESTAGEAASLARQAERAVSLLTPKTAARVYLCLTTRFLFVYRYDEVYGPAERAIWHARTAGDLRIESLVYVFRADAQQAQGRLAESAVSVTLARERALACGDLEALYLAADVEATLYEVRAEPLRTRDVRAFMLETATQLGDAGYIIETLCALALVAFSLGEWDASAGYFARSAALLKGDDFARWRSPAIGRAVLDALRAEQDLSPSTALAEIDDVADSHVGVWAIGMQAEFDLLAGRADVACARLRQAISRAEAIPRSHVPPASANHLLVALAWAELECGDQARAHETLAQVRQLAAAQSNRTTLADIEWIEALLALREGRWEDAQRSLEQSLAICREAPYPYAEAKACYLYGQVHAAAGRQADAREHYVRALAICERLGERRYRPHIERALGMSPEVAGSSDYYYD
ncbi:MAG: ATP-binding protein [Ktedonobacterales bacterium]